MKLQFTQTVQDKNTGEYYKPNTTYEFDDARAKEILSTGYAVVVEELKFAVGNFSHPLQTNTMYINSKYNTKEKMLKYLSETEGFFANTTVYAPIKHELGHKYYYQGWSEKLNSTIKNQK